MSLHGFNHFTIRAQDVEKTKTFYVDVLGMRVGSRPNFQNPGIWLYCGVTPVIHLFDGSLQDVYVGNVEQTTRGSGSVDHIAFAGDDYEGMRQGLDAKGIAYKVLSLPELDVDQLFVEDPNGLMVEMQFPRIES
ncbi:MAG: VOC family protein [Proteobacteria bacterium]|nr:VOC family protein [Pseudomonadota bacterium]